MPIAGMSGCPPEWAYAHSTREWTAQVPTHGGANKLPPETLAELVAGIGAAIDDVGGSFRMHYTTVVVTATLQ